MMTVAVALALLSAAGCSKSADRPVQGAGKDGAQASSRAGTQQGLRYRVRGIFERDTDRQRALGFNFIDSSPYRDQLKRLAERGLKGFVWLGGYSNEACKFNETDGWVRSRLSEIASHPAVGAYFVDDEPDAAKCPTAPEQVRARSDLVKSVDKGSPTFIASYRIDQFKQFAGTVDVLALDKYPCSFKHGCDYSRIGRQAAEADRLGVRYWGVIQAHGDEYYREPTPDELHRQFECWRGTGMEGYLVFGWRWPRDEPSRWLANDSELQSQLRRENAAQSSEGRARCG